MHLAPLLLSAALAGGFAVPSTPRVGPGNDAQEALAVDDPHRQFDFWIGEWSVQNRDIQPDGSWKDGDVTRARITPVCGGRAILEEWAGPFHGSFMNGFSLRAFDPTAQHWNLLLFWTTDGDSTFGRLTGKFRHGRGEFFAPATGKQRTRYTFSDGLPNSVRWDAAVTQDHGITWATDWIMEFTRTQAASEVTQDALFASAWTEGEVSTRTEARALDWMLGEWTGVREDAQGVKQEAQLRSKRLNKDCLVLDSIQTRKIGSESADWDERLNVRGWEQSKQRWMSWGLTETDSTLRPSLGHPYDDGISFEREDGEAIVVESLKRVDADTIVIEELRLTSDRKRRTVVATTKLNRVTPEQH